MTDLIIGMDGFIGRALCKHLPAALVTTRRHNRLESAHFFDMARPGPLPDADVVYLCAGVNGNLTCSCEDPRVSWKVNVDGTIHVAEHYRDKAFVVWISSTTVGWLLEHYGQQKRFAEIYLRGLLHVGIVRAGRVLQSNVDDLCALMIDIGRNRRRGVFVWNEDEKPYAH